MADRVVVRDNPSELRYELLVGDESAGLIAYRHSDAPGEIVRRIVSRAVRTLATEGEIDLRGAELDRLIEMLQQSGTATLRGVRCEGGREWRFTTAPARRAR